MTFKHSAAGIAATALLTVFLAASASGRERLRRTTGRSNRHGNHRLPERNRHRFAQLCLYKGDAETFFCNDVADAENNATIHSGKDLKSKTRWDGDIPRVTTTESGRVTVESYALTEDGGMTIRVERSDRKPFTLGFERR